MPTLAQLKEEAKKLGITGYSPGGRFGTKAKLEAELIRFKREGPKKYERKKPPPREKKPPKPKPPPAPKAKKEKKKSKFYDETLEAARAIKKAGYNPFDTNPRRTAKEAWDDLSKKEQQKIGNGKKWRVEYADKMLEALEPIFKKYAEKTNTKDGGSGNNARNQYNRVLIGKDGPRDEL